MNFSKLASVCSTQDRRPANLVMKFVGALALATAAWPWIIRASNSIQAANSAVSFAAGDAFGASVFPEADAASTAYTSIPTARALLNAPRWKKASPLPPVPRRPLDRHMALAVVGMPIDIGNKLLSGRAIEQACLQDEGNVFACGTQDKLYERPKYGKPYNLCDFDNECWHSTAAALVAIGNADLDPFAMSDQNAYANFKKTTFSAIARKDWKDFRESMSDDTRKPSFRKFLAERFPDFGPVLEQSIDVATVPTAGSPVFSAYITHQILVGHGLSPGAALIAVNVFRS